MKNVFTFCCALCLLALTACGKYGFLSAFLRMQEQAHV